MSDPGAHGDEMHEHLELGLVEVLERDRPCGAGVLASDDCVITCAHVVNTALGRDAREPAAPTAPVTVRFPYANRAKLTGEVVAWRPVGSPGGDVAVVRLHAPPPPGSSPVRLISCAQLVNHPFEVWGFPQGGAGEMLAEGILSRRRSDNLVQLRAGDGQPVRSGYSGAPVWDGRIGGVVGIVTSFDSADPLTRTAYLLPVDQLAAAWPDLVVTVTDDGDTADGGPGADDGVRVVGDRVSTTVEKWRDRDEIRRLLRAEILQAEHRIVSVTGRRGIGKSAVVAKVLAEFERPDPSRSPDEDIDGLVYLTARTGGGTLTLARIFESLAALSPPDIEHLTRRWDVGAASALPALWETLRHRRIVIALDNLDDLVDPATGQVTSTDLVTFLDSVARTPFPPHVVTTSPRPLGLPPDLLAHTRVLELTDGLPRADAVTLLRSMDPGGELSTLTDEQLGDAAEQVYRIPRALELLAQIMIDEAPFISDILDSSDPPETILDELVSRAFLRLDGPARLAVGVLALAGVPLAEPDLPTLLTGLVDTTEARRAVRHLIRSRELGFDTGTRLVQLHPLDADFVRQSLLDDDVDTQVRLDLRLAEWYAATRTPPSSWRVVTDATPNRREFHHRWRAGDHVGAMAALAEASDFLGRKGEGALLRSAAAREAEISDPAALVDLELCRFSSEFWDGSLDAAETALDRIRALATDAGRSDLIALADVYLSTVQRHRGDPAGSLASLARLGPDAVEVLSHELRLDALFQEGLSRCYLGDGPAAEAVADRLEAALLPDDPAMFTGRPSDIRCLARLVVGDFAGALAATSEGIALYLDSSVADNAGYLYNVRGLAWLHLGDLDAAGGEFRRGAAMGAEYGLDRMEGLCTINLAWTEARAGRWPEARAAAERGAACLDSNRVTASATGEAIGDLLALPPDAPASAIRDCLDRAVAGSAGNTDLYRPPPDVLDAITEAMAGRS